MKIHFLNDSKQGIGGGWSFMRNLRKALETYTDLQIVNSIEESDICFVSGPTMVSRQTIDKVQQLGKKLVVRLDNVPRNSRNRNTGTSRLKEFAERADMVVWQCQWAKDYLRGFLAPKDERIIYNGVDQDIFSPSGDRVQLGTEKVVYLYSRFNRDETKNWETAWYEFQLIAREHPRSKLVLVGNFSPEQIEYNFDFFRGEDIQYIPPVTEPEKMASIMRGCHFLLATYINDCFSNTYLEAMSCGVELTKINMSGGTPEMIALWQTQGREYFGLKRMADEYYLMFMEL